MSDTERLDWLEKHLLSLHHGKQTSSVDMGGKNIHGQFQLTDGPRKADKFRVYHRSIREAIDEANR